MPRGRDRLSWQEKRFEQLERVLRGRLKALDHWPPRVEGTAALSDESHIVGLVCEYCPERQRGRGIRVARCH